MLTENFNEDLVLPTLEEYHSVPVEKQSSEQSHFESRAGSVSSFGNDSVKKKSTFMLGDRWEFTKKR